MKYVSEVVKGVDIEIHKTSVYDVFVNDKWYQSSNSLNNIQSGLFEVLFDTLPVEERTTEIVMKMFFDLQLLIDICEQEFEEI